MIQIDCPFCGRRDEAEFTYRGDATVKRPSGQEGLEAFTDYVYGRSNPRGWHMEWWHHSGGCRQFLKVVRHTMTHEVRSVGYAGDDIQMPAE